MTESHSRCIQLRGVRVHNLKGVDLDLPLNRLVVFTGVSGSGKSSLAFDTLYAEGQRRYIETFSAYTRQFLEKLDKPEADRIDGIPPAIAVAQQSGTRRSSRSTVGTVTEIHDHLALLFARAGEVFCLTCGTKVEPADPSVVSRAIDSLPERTRYQVAFPMEVRAETDLEALRAMLRAEGFARVSVNGQTLPLDSPDLTRPESGIMDVVVDRLVRGSETPQRRLDSIETAFTRGLGRCRILTDSNTLTFFQGWRCGTCGHDYPEPDPRLFRYNSPLGACPTCEGFGKVIDLDLERIVPDTARSLGDGAIAPWNTPAYRVRLTDLLDLAPRLGLLTDVPFRHLTEAQKQLVIEGNPAEGFPGIRGFFRMLEKKSYKMHIRVFLSRWRGYSPCPACAGSRLRPESLAVQVGGRNIAEVAASTIQEVNAYLVGLEVGDAHPVVRRIVGQVASRLSYLDRIGLGYLTLDRPARTLSGGEAQRVALTTALGSGLVNTLYVLDEPSVGLHPLDGDRLIQILKSLRDAGNSVMVVEHDPEIMRAADQLVDIGPGAGAAGGTLLYQGPPDQIQGVTGSPTAEILGGTRQVALPPRRRACDKGALTLEGARGNNLKGIDVSFPLGVLCVITGVSGSGKSTLIEETLYPALRRRLGQEALPAAPHDTLTGTGGIDNVSLVDQSPIGRSGRSNPATYLKVFDEIRKTFAATHDAKLRNYDAGQFSFNVEGGRCNSCEGNGSLTIDMQFLPDVLIRCPECRGTRYRPETLEITYRGKNIAEVLGLSAREAFGFFRNRPKVQARLRPLMDVGLDYLQLGQPASTLSGGEAQRLKLASYLATSPGAMTRAAGRSKSLFILDEPTSGLHPADTVKLLDALNSLLDLGQSLIVIEHNLDIIRSADWIIDLGPGAGHEGGQVVAEGPPEEIAKAETPTGRVLAKTLRGRDNAI